MLNPRLQPVMNPDNPRPAGRPSGSSSLMVKDRVVQLTNNYDQDVYNGDLGTVVSANDRERRAEVRLTEGRGVWW